MLHLCLGPFPQRSRAHSCLSCEKQKKRIKERPKRSMISSPLWFISCNGFRHAIMNVLPSWVTARNPQDAENKAQKHKKKIAVCRSIE